MKKSLCLFLVVVMCQFSAFAFAENTDSTVKRLPDKLLEVDKEEGGTAKARLFDLDGVTGPDRFITDDHLKKNPISDSDLADKAITSDSVYISGNQYTVILPNGIRFNYSADKGVYVFTQDIIQQAALYNTAYDYPNSIVNDFISHGMHFNIYDDNTGLDIYLCVYNTDLASLYGNANQLSDEEAYYIAKYMLTDDEYMLYCDDICYGWAGGNVWFIGDQRSTDGTMVLCTFVGGCEIFAITSAPTDAAYDRVIDLLMNLTIS